MTVVYVIVAAVVFLLAGIALAIFGVAFWYLMKIVKELQASVAQLKSTFDELLGEGSFIRISKSLKAITENMPEILAAMKHFDWAMRQIFRSQEEVAAQTTNRPPQEAESGFYAAPTEAEAAANEEAAQGRKQRHEIPEEILARAVTDNQS